MFYESEIFNKFVMDAKSRMEEWQKRGVNFLNHSAGEHSAQLFKRFDNPLPPFNKGDYNPLNPPLLRGTNFLGFIDKSEIKQREVKVADLLCHYLMFSSV